MSKHRAPPPSFDHERAAHMLQLLKAPNAVPFYTIAAERAGLSRQSVRNWVHRVETAKNPDELDPTLVMFVREVKRIRAEWIATQTEYLTCGPLLPNGERGAVCREKGKHIAWLLQKIDKDNFDPPKEKAEPEEKPEPEDKTTAERKTVDEAAEALGTPETAEFQH